MWKKRSKTIIPFILMLLFICTDVEGGNTEILPVNRPADLDLSGNIVHAINFGNNGTPTIDGVYFHQDQDLPNVTTSKSGESLATSQGGAYPGTADSDLNVLLVGVVWKNSGGNVTTSVTVGGLEVGKTYQLQLIFYTDHYRPMNAVIEGEVVAERFDPYAIQERENAGGGAMIKHHFTAGDSNLNINMTSTAGLASLISGLVLTEANVPTSFTDFGSGTTTKLYAGGATWQLNWGQGPWTWSELTGDPLLDTNVSAVLDLRTTAAADVSADLVATLPIGGTLTLTAHDTHFPEVTTGTMVLSGAGMNIIDINADRVIVDEGSGMFLAPFHPPGPQVMLILEEATGVFAHITQVGPWQLSIAGSYAIPLIEGLELQDNIMTALGGKVSLIGGIGEFSLAGLYTVDASKLPLAHWTLDETQGMFALDTISGNDGIALGSPAWQPEGGYVGGALEFDGINDMIIAKFVLNPEDGPFSVLAWIKGGEPGQVIISQNAGSNWLQVDMDGKLMTELNSTDPSSNWLHSDTVITDGSWHHVGFVWDGNQRILYVDDVQVAIGVQAGLRGSTAGLTIGAGKGSQPGSFWFGLIDDVRVYDRVVTP